MIDADDCFKFLLVNYCNVARRCTDIATEICPHYKDTYPGGIIITGIKEIIPVIQSFLKKHEQ